MAITTTWSIKLRQYSHTIDVTSRTLGANVTQIVEVGTAGTGEATIQLDNNDGAFTPFNGGTYSDLNAYGYALIIDCTVNDGLTNYERNVYGGVVSDFKLNDDGINSTVTISAVDGLTLAGRSEVGYVNLDTDLYFSNFMREAITLLLDGYIVGGNVLLKEVPVPFLGAGDIDTRNLDRDVTAQQSVFEWYGYQEYTIADVLNSSFLPAAPAVMFPGSIDFETVSGKETARYRFMHHDTSLTPNNTYRKDFVFAQNPTGTELPFKNLDRGYNMDAVVNTAQITRNNPKQFAATGTPPDTETRSFASADSVAQFGVRAVEYGTVAIRWDVATENFGNLEPGAQQVAERWANRYDTPRFLSKQLTITAKQVDALAATTAAQQWADYLDCETGLWNTAQVIYSPTGGSERTDNVVVASRQINITPADTVVNVFLLPMQDNMSFTLGDTMLGKLGGTLDTYDDTDYTYDELFGYDGHPAEGNRLY